MITFCIGESLRCSGHRKMTAPSGSLSMNDGIRQMVILHRVRFLDLRHALPLSYAWHRCAIVSLYDNSVRAEVNGLRGRLARFGLKGDARGLRKQSRSQAARGKPDTFTMGVRLASARRSFLVGVPAVCFPGYAFP